MAFLSIIIPAFEEERKIERDVRAAAEFLVGQKMTGEVIISDDGSSDNTANRAEMTEVPQAIHRIVIRSGTHRGKGSAVRNGVLASEGEYVMFADSGLTIPYENVLRGLRMLRAGDAELAHGSRELPGSVIHKEKDRDRKIISKGFRMAARAWMHVPRSLTDTQCGFKIYRGDVARSLYAECITDGFMFDIEIILRAVRRGYRIAEFPVEWTCDRDSRLSVRRSSMSILRDLRTIRQELQVTDQDGRA
jgi:dolichyl-phosphate beta-glucosyltransferase